MWFCQQQTLVDSREMPTCRGGALFSRHRKRCARRAEMILTDVFLAGSRFQKHVRTEKSINPTCHAGALKRRCQANHSRDQNRTEHQDQEPTSWPRTTQNGLRSNPCGPKLACFACLLCSLALLACLACLLCFPNVFRATLSNQFMQKMFFLRKSVFVEQKTVVSLGF